MQAADNFIVYRPNFGYHTILAGYPWFLDWGRDSLISFEGLLLKNGILFIMHKPCTFNRFLINISH